MTTIYTLAHPVTHEIRYIGKTHQSLKIRLTNHIGNAKKYNKTYVQHWITSLLKQDLRPIIRSLDTCEDKDGSSTEIYWISQFKTWEFKLTNLSDGGEGVTMIRSKEWTMKVGAKHKGKIVSQEVRNKIANTLSGRKLSDEHRQRIRTKLSSIDHPVCRSIKSINPKTKIENTYKSIQEASAKTGVSASSISNNLNHRSNSAGGLQWSYSTNNE